MKKQAVFAFFLAAALPFFYGGCGRRSGEAVDWLDIMARLYRLENLARMDQPGASLFSSWDRTGGNEDYNNFYGTGPDGWVVLADVKGPGYLSRFWFTGATSDQHRIRFFFDGEREARLDLTLAELGGGRPPFVKPFAGCENYCWYNHIPLPFAKRLVVMSQGTGPKVQPSGAKLFFQLCVSPLPPQTGVVSFAGKTTAEELARFEQIREAWIRESAGGNGAELERAEKTLELAPGADVETIVLQGPGMIRRLSVKPDFDALPSRPERERFLRETVLRLRWDGHAEASVAVPLGDFFGSVWRRTRFESACFGATTNGFYSAFPMPFRSGATVSFENQGGHAVPLHVAAEWTRLAGWDETLGYFHAAWNATGPDEQGRPHYVARIRSGAGKYVGCILSAWSFDNTFWLLEGDDYMTLESASEPEWRGTGLEDYFNGGWYYQNVLALPLHGVTQKLFFRTVQYRIHLTDPVRFNSALDAAFERGPDNNSRGQMESTAFYYLAVPAAAGSNLDGGAEARLPPEDTWEKINLMIDLLNYERFADYKGALEYAESFLERYPKAHFAPVLRLRVLAYREKLEGFEAIKPLYEKFLASETYEPALEQAKLILWFHEKPNRALLGVYANMPTSAFLSGRPVADAGRPESMTVVGLEPAPGRHVLALRVGWRPYPNWVQACLRTHHGDFVTTPECRAAYEPKGKWMLPDYDDSGWKKIGGTGVKGPPEEPFVWVDPNAFVDMQSRAVGIRPEVEFKDKEKGAAVIRMPLFVIPE